MQTQTSLTQFSIDSLSTNNSLLTNSLSTNNSLSTQESQVSYEKEQISTAFNIFTTRTGKKTNGMHNDGRFCVFGFPPLYIKDLTDSGVINYFQSLFSKTRLLGKNGRIDTGYPQNRDKKGTIGLYCGVIRGFGKNNNRGRLWYGRYGRVAALLLEFLAFCSGNMNVLNSLPDDVKRFIESFFIDLNKKPVNMSWKFKYAIDCLIAKEEIIDYVAKDCPKDVVCQKRSKIMFPYKRIVIDDSIVEGEKFDKLEEEQRILSFDVKLCEALNRSGTRFHLIDCLNVNENKGTVIVSDEINWPYVVSDEKAVEFVEKHFLGVRNKLNNQVFQVVYDVIDYEKNFPVLHPKV
jgi:(2Fe-2S) ferredoxin